MPVSAVALRLKQMLSPSTPSAGENALYPTADDKWYSKNAVGTEVLVGPGAASVDEVVVQTSAPTNVGGYPEVWVDLTAGPPAGGAMVVIMTQAAYDALAVKDANTVYVVT
jgi:hypothetical protein